MTGAYLRVNRNNKWENVEVEHLTDEERQCALGSKDLMPWLNLACKKLAEIEKLIDQLVEDGILLKNV